MRYDEIDNPIEEFGIVFYVKNGALYIFTDGFNDIEIDIDNNIEDELEMEGGENTTVSELFEDHGIDIHKLIEESLQ